MSSHWGPCCDCVITGSRESDAERWARLFHDTYETLAPEYGYETRPETREFDPTSSNGRLMMAVCANVVAELLASQASEIAAHKLHIEKLYSKLENRAREFSPGDKS